MQLNTCVACSLYLPMYTHNLIVYFFLLSLKSALSQTVAVASARGRQTVCVQN